MNKLKFNDFVQTKIQFIDCTHFFHQQNHPTFHSEDLERGSECFFSLSTLIVYDVRPPIVQRYKYIGVCMVRCGELCCHGPDPGLAVGGLQLRDPTRPRLRGGGRHRGSNNSTPSHTTTQVRYKGSINSTSSHTTTQVRYTYRLQQQHPLPHHHPRKIAPPTTAPAPTPPPK